MFINLALFCLLPPTREWEAYGPQGATGGYYKSHYDSRIPKWGELEQNDRSDHYAQPCKKQDCSYNPFHLNHLLI
ncbi:MAG: hypothetical protein UW24_C0006G0023 [Parcubacteria group bacterium GW2011_GWA2_44_12]|nr:MAG: hypothetical protein UW24_C0006G0023 [Parcubacteria group bacterium GW2011_GWA2_44_12]